MESLQKNKSQAHVFLKLKLKHPEQIPISAVLYAIQMFWRQSLRDFSSVLTWGEFAQLIQVLFLMPHTMHIKKSQGYYQTTCQWSDHGSYTCINLFLLLNIHWSLDGNAPANSVHSELESDLNLVYKAKHVDKERLTLLH